MTTYTDIPAANALYEENQRILAAIAAIDAGAFMTNFTIGAAPPPAPDPENPVLIAPMTMPSGIVVPPPVDAALMADLRAWLVSRSTALLTQMATMGVSESPPAAA